MGFSRVAHKQRCGRTTMRGRSRSRRLVALLGACSLVMPATAAVESLTAAPASAGILPDAPPSLYSRPGTYSYNVPAGVTAIAFEVVGGVGSGIDFEAAGPGGTGGTVQGLLPVTSGERLTVYVASGGDYFGFGGSGWAQGGNGGGGFAGGAGGASAITAGTTPLVVAGGGGGGGSAPILGVGGGAGGGGGTTDGVTASTAGTGTSGGPSSDTSSINIRSCAGGGGGGGATTTTGGAGGSGGSTTPGSLVPCGNPGSPGTAGGYALAGRGGGAASSSSGGGGGGGGGYYGGGGGGGAGYNAGGGGGGGGSSYASPVVVGATFVPGQTGLAQTGPGLEQPDGYVSLTAVSGGTGSLGGSAGPSSSCTSGLITDSTLLGERVWLYAQQADATHDWVCFRIQDAATQQGFGGQLVITDSAGLGSLGVPTVDNQATACSTTPGNQLTVPHPIAAGTLAGHTYLVDAYANTSTAWVCFSADTMQYRVVIPVQAPGVTVPSVTFNPDPGTP